MANGMKKIKNEKAKTVFSARSFPVDSPLSVGISESKENSLIVFYYQNQIILVCFW
jgi:hypothetical protein